VRRFGLVAITGLIGVALGLSLGLFVTQKSRLSGAQAALVRASEAISVGRNDEALEYALAAIDRNPDLYPAYELAGDAIAEQQNSVVRKHLYRAALAELARTRRSPVAGALTEAQVATERARLQGKLDALSNPSAGSPKPQGEGAAAVER
jgi:hypothetical protein